MSSRLERMRPSTWASTGYTARSTSSRAFSETSYTVTREHMNHTAQPPATSARMSRTWPGRRKPSSASARREWEKFADTSDLSSEQREQTVREARRPPDVVMAPVELAVGDLVALRPQ